MGPMTAKADPKPTRIRDDEVYTLFHKRDHVCVCCGSRDVSAAHIIGRGAGGDDVVANLVPLCGDGSRGCHGAYDNGHAYQGAGGRRITPEIVRWSIARYIRSEAGEDAAVYLIAKLGPFGAEAFVQKLEGTPRL